jgi:hypothetical protein
MNGDFSQNPFRNQGRYSRVLMQQGRVLLDSDWNEQAAIFNHYFQTLARDLIGPYGGPAMNCGFTLAKLEELADEKVPNKPKLDGNHNFWIGPGRYYVDGLLCENNDFKLYAPPISGAPGWSQPDVVPKSEEWTESGSYLVYLDVWERHVTALEDEAIREVALGPQGPDTTTRVKIVWQVKTVQVSQDFGLECTNSVAHPNGEIHSGWADLLRSWQPLNRGRLQAKADEPDDISATNPCIISPDARYRGAENQLYRVEIHQGGPPENATFKWARDNGSVALPIQLVSGNKVTLEHMGRDEHFGLQVGDWVEIEGTNYDTVDNQNAPPLLQVDEVNYVDRFVLLSDDPKTEGPARVLRRWDQKAGDKLLGGSELREGTGAVIIKEGTPEKDNWLTLEDGVQIQFRDATPANIYRRGDYWLIPARTATGDVEWPGPLNAPRAIPPHGVEHHYAPLASIQVDANKVTKILVDVRRKFRFLAECETS